MKKRFKYIHNLTQKEQDDLYKLVQSHNMKFLGNGKKWTKDKINKLIKFSKEDYNNKFKFTKYLFIILFINDKLIGLGYIHPGLLQYKNNLQIALIIKDNEQNKGYSKLIISKLIKLNNKYFKNKLLSFVKSTNIKSINSFKKYKKINEVFINNYLYFIYDLN